jgi:hypothetical protein
MVSVNKIAAVQWVMVLICLSIVVFLSIQNRNLARKNQFNEDSLIQKYELELKLVRAFSQKFFPINLNNAKFHFLDSDDSLTKESYLLVAFNLTVCGQCLSDQLILLHNLKNKVHSRVGLLAVIGIADETEKSEVLSMYQSGLLTFPFTFVEDDSLDSLFALEGNLYLDTPIYFVVDNLFRVQDVYKPPAYDIPPLERWLINKFGLEYSYGPASYKME